MSRLEDLLPDGWDQGVDEDEWPEALIAAVRVDVAALSSPRAIATLRAWRASLRGAEPSRLLAERRLGDIGEALLTPPPGGPIATERFDTLALRPALHLPPDSETDSAVRAVAPEPSRPPEHTAWAYGGLGGAAEPEPEPEPEWAPASAVRTVDPLLADLAGHAAVDPDELTGETMGVDESAPLPKLRPSTQEPPSLDFTDEPPTAANIAPVIARRGTPSPAARPAPPPPPPVSQVMRAPSVARGPARGGLVRRTSVPPQENARPRASLVQVRAFYSAIAPLCRELVPLTYERRSRRFWTHWREVSGERGVHREAAERILETARDFRALCTELIAEVLAVDLESVRTLVDRIEAEDPPSASGPRATEERARGPLVGASVRVSGLPPEDD